MLKKKKTLVNLHSKCADSKANALRHTQAQNVFLVLTILGAKFPRPLIFVANLNFSMESGGPSVHQ